MKRIMIIGQPGSGKSTLARKLGAITHLPVVHMDHIHWKSGWVERDGPEKDRLCAEVHARPEWIFEGGRSTTWPDRLARADMLIWLDVPLLPRAWRVALRTLRFWGRTRPDLPDGCPEKFSLEFWGYIWRTRRSGRARMLALWDSTPPDMPRHRLRRLKDVSRFLDGLSRAAAVGNLGISHR